MQCADSENLLLPGIEKRSVDVVPTLTNFIKLRLLPSRVSKKREIAAMLSRPYVSADFDDSPRFFPESPAMILSVRPGKRGAPQQPSASKRARHLRLDVKDESGNPVRLTETRVHCTADPITGVTKLNLFFDLHLGGEKGHGLAIEAGLDVAAAMLAGSHQQWLKVEPNIKLEIGTCTVGLDSSLDSANPAKSEIKSEVTFEKPGMGRQKEFPRVRLNRKVKVPWQCGNAATDCAL